MKLSLSWIFDYIESDWRSHDVNHIVARFNQVTAEIEHVTKIDIPLEQFFIMTCSSAIGVRGSIAELDKEILLQPRIDEAVLPSIARYNFLVKQEGDSFLWATLADFGVEKGGLVPALDIPEKDLSGGWRSTFVSQDIILEVDNKSITHRPDMWGHCGFAREIAAFLELPFKAKDEFIHELDVQRYDSQSHVTPKNPFMIDNQSPDACFVFNGLYISSFNNKPSNPFLASRLMMVGARPMSGIIDITNYLALDWGQPVHAYDAARIEQKKIVIRKAKESETLALLDGNDITLMPQDLVIADAKKPLCLAGVKGGKNDSVSASTTSIFFEAANFEAATVRRSALHHKTRTDSSSRFEKTLDPNLALETVFRFVALLEQCGMDAVYADSVISIGKTVQQKLVELTHDFLEKKTGIVLSSDTVIVLLSRLEFNVSIKYTEPLTYEVQIPTFRSSKDVSIKEDILEEVIRAYGFHKIPLVLPLMQREPFDMTVVHRSRTIRQYFAHGVGMMEQRNYALFDEQFLASLGITEHNTVNIINPVSENHARLVTSLIPGLLKNVVDNMVHQDHLAFFELGRVWSRDKQNASEHARVSGIFFEKRKPIDFYEKKYHLEQLFRALGFTQLPTWKKIKNQKLLWQHPYQTAELFYGDLCVGTAGMVNPTLLASMGALSESQAFVFELDGTFLQSQALEPVKYQHISRFQETFFDISLTVPLTVTSEKLEHILSEISPLVTQVELIDFYESQASTDTRSITFRLWLQHMDHTLEKSDIDTVYHKSIAAVTHTGAQLRS